MHKQQRKLASRITQQPLRGQSEKSSPAPNCKQLSLWHQGQDQDLQLANAGRARASATRRTACPTSCYKSAVRHVHYAVQSKSTGLTIRSSRARFAVSARLETSGQRAGLTQALGLQEQSQQSPGRAQAAAATCITHHTSRNSHSAVSRSKAHLHRTANSFLFGTKVKVKIYSLQTLVERRAIATRRTACPTS
mgnify:CR=1 FL=1